MAKARETAAVRVRPFAPGDLAAMREIWNEVVDAGQAFPQEERLTPEGAAEFFAAQSACGVAVDGAGRVLGLYILHPNNVGRCGHIANASYAVAGSACGQGVGRALVRASLAEAGRLGFRILQFNAVAVDNTPARHLYEKLGFTPLGIIPGGFRRPGGEYVDIALYWHAVGEADA
ncbi:MAG: GNAT family N-acetyltransferase [Desulfovibrio sp.]|uniref:GNAT family N-acetyltransferase n=1 Tax=Desulfovibrio sp. TaxID=885 RepID=UPI001A710F48|nr:GNAT family N-acetyltransferase [Desulfovibrio sp.]MBD5417755.1 GNAT family N-acetyltransferase [Desulfovibrio sp.]